ncbi:MAG: aminomethyl-transferring glycine dehydrogenase subunit GcvPA [Candidatus Omnitrophica bacterium]|nr:aminomethyl-transferring glycine dehydrogenase subunit GcvPA [Candidatus Omnitrophota bacterium]
MSYVANTKEEKSEMLKAVGINDGNIDRLFDDIPKSLRAKSFALPKGKSEYEVTRDIKKLSSRNNTGLISFLGAGYYDHFIPEAVNALAARSEFYTAYTPYQPEASQGTLQAIYEYQSSICRLTGMGAANASLYDGSTALYEACMMAIRITGKNKILSDMSVNPIHRKILYSYTGNLSIEFKEIPLVHGQSDRKTIDEYLDDNTAAIILQNPNFFGAIDDFTDIIKKCHDKGALAIVSVYPISLGLLKTPAEMGADIVVGEGQSLGMPLSFGGPYLGIMATTKEYVRKMPGRIVGATTDTDGKRGFVLTLQTREQHIRREKATSNICSNEALCALRAVIYLSIMGKEGLKEVAGLCFKKAEYAKNIIGKIKGVEVKRSSPTFNEFTLNLPKDPEEIIQKMLAKGFIAGFPAGRHYPDLKNYMIVAVTEKHSKEEIDKYAKELESALWS